MSGHSKWANIKHKKEINDKQRSSIFGKLSKMITLAVLESNGVINPENNIRLRLAIDKAKADNLPKENIRRAIEKGIGPNKMILKEVVYEAFGPASTVFIIQATSDSPNRTSSEIRNVLERHGGKLASQGAVNYLFQKCGIIIFPRDKNKEDNIYAFADNIKMIDIEEDANFFTIYFPYEKLGHVKDFINELKSEGSAEMDYRPTTLIKIESSSDAKKIITLIESLEELNDVHKVFTNFIIANGII